MSGFVTFLLRVLPLWLVERIPIRAIQRDINGRKFFLAAAGAKEEADD